MREEVAKPGHVFGRERHRDRPGPPSALRLPTAITS